MNLGLAATLWRRGMNTAEIARAMTVREHKVYNDLSAIRYIASIDESLQQEV
jgi:DNA-binding CsgD family transcriptional regulator